MCCRVRLVYDATVDGRTVLGSVSLSHACKYSVRVSGLPVPTGRPESIVRRIATSFSRTSRCVAPYTVLRRRWPAMIPTVV